MMIIIHLKKDWQLRVSTKICYLYTMVHNIMINIMQLHFVLLILITKLCLGENNVKIISGFECQHRTVPFLATIELEKKVLCGGSVLSSHWAMTAAHCMLHKLEKYIVWTGFVQSTQRFTQSARIKRIIRHDKYVKLKAKIESNDICLLELKTSIKENPNTIYAEIPSMKIYQSLIKQHRCNLSLTLGFGATDVMFENHTVIVPGPQTNTLQCAFHTIISDNDCKKYNKHIDTSTILCAHGTPGTTVSTCYKDAGGPLICEGMQVGIVSSMEGCGLGHPVLYMKVAAFYDFIRKYVSDVKTVDSDSYTCLKLEISLLITCLSYCIMYNRYRFEY